MANNNENKIQGHDLDTTLATMKSKEFWIGLITTLLLIVVAVRLLPWNKLNTFMANNESNKVVSPVPQDSDASNSAKMTVTQTVTPKMSPVVAMKANPTPTMKKEMTNSKLKSISTLADTTGNEYYVVLSGDNYYKISVAVCGTGKYFESIQAQNNYMPLHNGDYVTVTCSF